MSDSLQETNVEEIARELTTRRNQGQRTTLFLGSRTGGLFGNEYLYETLKQFSLLNFDTLSNIDKFRECYYVLSKHFSETERHNILVGALSTVRYREEDKLLAELIRAGFFEIIISTNIDSLLEDGCSSLGLREPEDYRVFIPRLGDIIEVERKKPKYSSIIKVFGDLNSRHYYTAGETFDPQAVDDLREFLKSKSSNEVLMIGYDPVWDHEIEQAFPSTGSTMWYAKERESYSSFVRKLFKYLGEEIRQNEATTVPKPTLLQFPDKEKKEVFISYSHHDKKL